MMKRWISVILACLLMLSGCGTNRKTSGTGKKIAVTIFPEYDWIMNILGDNPADMDVTLLLDSGADLHSYQPSAQDIMKIADCDLFVCVFSPYNRRHMQLQRNSVRAACARPIRCALMIWPCRRIPALIHGLVPIPG